MNAEIWKTDFEKKWVERQIMIFAMAFAKRNQQKYFDVACKLVSQRYGVGDNGAYRLTEKIVNKLKRKIVQKEIWMAGEK